MGWLILYTSSFNKILQRFFLFGKYLEINCKLEKPTGKYIMIIEHSKDYDRDIHKKIEGKKKREKLSL